MPHSTTQRNRTKNERNQPNFERQFLKFVNRLESRVVILGSILIFFVGIIMIWLSYALVIPSPFGAFTDILRGIGEGLVTAIIITGLVSFFVKRYPEKVRGVTDKLFTQEVRSKLMALQKDDMAQMRELTTLQKDLSAQTRELTTFQDDVRTNLEQLIAKLNYMKGLISIPRSLEVLTRKGFSRVYGSRPEAVEDMILDLRDPVTHIRIMGISLSSLIRYRDASFYKVWDEITKYVNSHVDLAHPNNSRLEIQVLLIDPKCLGAQLRSEWESDHPQHSTRMDVKPTSSIAPLEADVLQTAQTLKNFMQTIPNSPEAGISFKVRLYRLPPQLFLLSTDKVSYVMPYYFWRGTEDMPLFKLINDASQLSQGMHDHFDLIWQSASISLEQFLEEQHVGLDKGMYISGAINVFEDTSKTRERILYPLNHAKERVYIQGISLNTTLGSERQQDDIITAIKDLVESGVEVKILLLNPESDQAKFRAYREWCLQESRSALTFEQYRQQPLIDHKYEKLYWDTATSIKRIAHLQQDLLDQNAKPNTFGIKLYDAAPSCFMFMVDNNVLIEQYVYGSVTKVRPNGQSPFILGGEMPLVEYVSQVGDLYEERPDKRVFEMMKDHFNFIFDHYAHSLDDLVIVSDNVK